MNFLNQESEPQLYDHGSRMSHHAKSYRITQSESQQLLEASISSQYPLNTLGSSEQNFFSDPYATSTSISISSFDYDIMGYTPPVRNGYSSSGTSTSALKIIYPIELISDSVNEQPGKSFRSPIQAMKFDFTYASNNFLMLNQSLQLVDKKKSPTNTEIPSKSKEARLLSIQCKLCPWSHEKSSGLGGHMSKKHPGQSKKYIKKMETRRLRTQPRMTSKARSQAILSQIRRAVAIQPFLNFL